MTPEMTPTRQPADAMIADEPRRAADGKATGANVMRPRKEMAAWLNVLPMVRWDRCVVDEAAGRTVVYGWIDRADDRTDFVVVEFDRETVGFTTSSARWSQTISQALFGRSDNHNPCRRVTDEFGDLVRRTVPARHEPA
jgi:hypothetical protein